MIIINRYVEVLKEVESLMFEYSNYDYDKTIKFIKTIVDQLKYSKGGLNRRYGLFEFSIIDRKRICNAPFGREIKNAEKGYNYKYYYSNDQLLLLEKFSDNNLLESKIFLHNTNGFIILDFDNNGDLFELDKYECDNLKRITRRLLINNNLWGTRYIEEIYKYIDDNNGNFYLNEYGDSMSILGRICYEMLSYEYHNNNIKLNNNEKKLVIIEDRQIIKEKGLECLDKYEWGPGYQVFITKINDSTGD